MVQLKRWVSMLGSVGSIAGVIGIGLGTGPSLRAAEPHDPVVASRRVSCETVDPGFAYNLEERLRGLDDPGFTAGDGSLGTPSGIDSVDPGFWQPKRSCPIGPLADILASPASETLGIRPIPAATPAQR
jgi:hypothetical protein